MDEADDINRLIRQLNTGGRALTPVGEAEEAAEGPLPPGEPAPRSAARLIRWLAELVEHRGSDLLLVAGAPPCVRVDGRVARLPEAPLSGEEIEESVLPAMNELSEFPSAAYRARAPASVIRRNALQHLNQEIALTRKQGSMSLEESLGRLVREGVIDGEEARLRAAHPEELKES